MIVGFARNGERIFKFVALSAVVPCVNTFVADSVSAFFDKAFEIFLLACVGKFRLSRLDVALGEFALTYTVENVISVFFVNDVFTGASLSNVKSNE